MGYPIQRQAVARPGFAQTAAEADVRGYWVLRIRVFDLARYERMIDAVIEQAQALGARFLVRVASDDRATRTQHQLVVAEFPSLVEAQAAWDEPAYRASLGLIDGACDYEVQVVAGQVD